MPEQQIDQREYDGLPAGTILKGYRIERELGRGAMAVVYLATQIELNRPVALKVLSDELAQDKDFVIRFFNEAQAAAALNHPNIIKALDAGVTEDGIHFFCMEYVDGDTLLNLIKRHGRISQENCRKWFLEIAEALNYGWELHRFTHGDLKPENIMIDADGHAKLADFGLAKVDGHDYSGKVVMLTPLYAPPEMIRGERFVSECRPDIYAFGASLYHALAGTPPFPGTDAQMVIKRQLNEPLEPLSHRNLAVSKEWSDFVGKMLVKEMSKRMPSWAAVIDGLRKLDSSRRKVFVVRKDSVAAASCHAQSASQNRNSVIVLILTFLCMVLLGILGVFVWRATDSGKRKPSSPPRQTSWKAPSKPSPLAVPQQPSTPVPVKPVTPPVQKLVEKPPVAVNLGRAPKREIEEILSDDVTPSKVKSDSGDLPDSDDDGYYEEEEAQGAGRKIADGMLDPRSFVIPVKLEKSQKIFLADLELGLLWMDMTKVGSLPSVSRDQRSQLDGLSRQSKSHKTRRLASFVLNEIVASYDSFPETIAKNISKISGFSIDLGNERVRLVACDRLQGNNIVPVVEMKSPSRRLERRTTWSGLHRSGVLMGLCHQMVLASRGDFEASRSYLSYIALSGRASAVEQLLSGFPKGVEKSFWNHLVAYEKMTGQEQKEQNALEQMKRLLHFAANGVWIGIEQSCCQLSEEKNTEVYRRFEPVIKDLLSQSRKQVGIYLNFDQLWKQVMDVLGRGSEDDSDGVEASRLLMFWQAWYGRSMERSEMKSFNRCLRNAMKLLSREEKLRKLTDAVGFLFVRPDEQVQRSLGRAQAYSPAKDESALRERYRDIQALLCVSSRLEMGDWQYSSQSNRRRDWRQLETRSSLRSLDDDGELLFALACYGRSLLWLRYQDNYTGSDRHMGHLLSLCKGKSPNYPVILSIALENWLLGRRGPKTQIENVTQRLLDGDMLENLGSRRDGAKRDTVDTPLNRRRCFYLYVANLLENEHKERVKAILCAVLKEKSPLRRILGIDEKEESRLMCLLDYLKGVYETPLVDSQVEDLPLALEYLRAALSALESNDLTEDLAGDAETYLQGISDGCRLIGGDVIFDLTLRRVACELRSGQFTEAVKIIHWSLKQQGSCLFPYHFRLLALRSGIMSLCGVKTGMLSAAVLARSSSVMSKQERQILELFGTEDAERRMPADIDPTHQTCFWFQWMAFCEAAGRGDTKESARRLAGLKRMSGVVQGAERSLIASADQWLKDRNH